VRFEKRVNLFKGLIFESDEVKERPMHIHRPLHLYMRVSLI